VHHNHTLLWLGIIYIMLAALFLRATIASHSYSGMGAPPMFGDYEAQRHWMEITVNTPPHEWYVQTPSNDLQYWGIDYPPVSAYWAWLTGTAARALEPAMVALGSSRGYESASSKFFFRSTVMVAEFIFFVPACAVATIVLYRRYRTSSRVLVLMHMLYNPLVLLIDHGHFQYNCIALGLSIYAVAAVLHGRHVLAAILYCCAFLFKQNALYYALPFFAVLLGLALRRGGADTDQQGDAATTGDRSVAGAAGAGVSAGAGARAGASAGPRVSWACSRQVLLLGITVLGTVLAVFAPIIFSGDTPWESFMHGTVLSYINMSFFLISLFFFVFFHM
jgi:hypothetical protein